MKRMIAIVLVGAALMVVTFASVPRGVQYQGTLAHPDGTPMDTTVAMLFELFADSTGGAAVWSESHSAVTVTDGLFSIRLGWITEFSDNVLQLPQLWICVTVGNNSEMQPRVKVVSTFFALRAGEVDTIKAENIAQILQLFQSLPDADGDGHTKISTGGDDCNDLDPTIYSGAPEVCNYIDDDCDAQIDEGFTPGTWYQDLDADGWGNCDISVVSCNQPQGYVLQCGDCNDNDVDYHPGAPAVCGFDYDCNGQIGELGAQGCVQRWSDIDGDGWGGYTLACVCPCCPVWPYSATQPGDCNDYNANINPGMPEICDMVDNNCNGQIDDGAGPTWYQDADGDGFGNPNISTVACIAPAGYVIDNQDCDDTNPNVHPGANEECNGLDDDCDGGIDNGGVLCPAGLYCVDGECIEP